MFEHLDADGLTDEYMIAEHILQLRRLVLSLNKSEIKPISVPFSSRVTYFFAQELYSLADTIEKVSIDKNLDAHKIRITKKMENKERDRD